MVFPHRPPFLLRFVAYLAGGVDLAVGLIMVAMGLWLPATSGLQFGGLVLIAVCWPPPWILLGVRYEIEGGDLLVRRGPFLRRIALGTLEEVRASTPLPGLEGVIVSFRKGERRVREALFPHDPAAFLQEVQRSASFLVPAGEGALRRGR